jgi:Domain of unknown function (DUF4145)
MRYDSPFPRVSATESRKIVLPSIREAAFCCPHCDVFTTQYWYEVLAEEVRSEKGLPFVLTSQTQEERALHLQGLDASGEREMIEWLDRALSGMVIFDSTSGKYPKLSVFNLNLSKCYSCKKIAVWVFDRLVFPAKKSEVRPNPDLPENVIRDFEEAREIVDASPRGAAALLRLCIQKLCAHLGEKEKTIDDAIASLVRKGLNPLVQQALDIVRVIGNESVHPGELDLRDDRETASELFGLVNAIADQMITHPKAVEALYKKLPENKRKAIEKRDRKP